MSHMISRITTFSKVLQRLQVILSSDIHKWDRHALKSLRYTFSQNFKYFSNYLISKYRSIVIISIILFSRISSEIWSAHAFPVYSWTLENEPFIFSRNFKLTKVILIYVKPITHFIWQKHFSINADRPCNSHPHSSDPSEQSLNPSHFRDVK